MAAMTAQNDSVSSDQQEETMTKKTCEFDDAEITALRDALETAVAKIAEEEATKRAQPYKRALSTQRQVYLALDSKLAAL